MPNGRIGGRRRRLSKESRAGEKRTRKKEKDGKKGRWRVKKRDYGERILRLRKIGESPFPIITGNATLALLERKIVSVRKHVYVPREVKPLEQIIIFDAYPTGIKEKERPPLGRFKLNLREKTMERVEEKK